MVRAGLLLEERVGRARRVRCNRAARTFRPLQELLALRSAAARPHSEDVADGTPMGQCPRLLQRSCTNSFARRGVGRYVWNLPRSRACSRSTTYSPDAVDCATAPRFRLDEAIRRTLPLVHLTPAEKGCQSFPRRGTRVCRRSEARLSP